MSRTAFRGPPGRHRVPPYRLGFAVKVLGNGVMKTADTRRWRSGPHLSRSIQYLEAVFDYLEQIDVRVYRMSSSTVPYGTHPDLAEFDYRRQIEQCATDSVRSARRRVASACASRRTRASTR